MLLRRLLLVLFFVLVSSVHASPTPIRSRPDLPPDDGSPNLWQMAYSGDVESLGSLLDRGAAIDEFSPRGTTPLIYALRNRQFAAAELLLARGANPSQTSRDGSTPLSFAFWAGIDRENPDAFDVRWLRLLLSRGADPLAYSKYREPLLFLVASHYPSQPKALRFVLSYSLPVDQRTGDDCRTALAKVVNMEVSEIAAKNEIVRLLLTAGANPNVSWVSKPKHSYDTPLIDATYRFTPEMGQLGARASARVRLELVDLLLEAGADPRFGGDGSNVRQPPECLESSEDGPGSSATAAAAWSGLFEEQSNPALTEIFGHVTSFRPALERLANAAAPIGAGEIGYRALELTLAHYSHLLSHMERIAGEVAKKSSRAMAEYPELLERKSDLEYAQARLLELRVRVNPEHVLLSKDSEWNDLWLAQTTRDESGIESLPLFEHRMPDELYKAYLIAGASPALRKGNHLDEHASLITHLIRARAASKLELVRQYPGLLTRIPTWCGRSVADIGRALGRSDVAAQPNLATPTGKVARRFLLDLLQQPACRLLDEEQRRELPALLARLGDPEIDQALAASALGIWNGRRAPVPNGRRRWN